MNQHQHRIHTTLDSSKTANVATYATQQSEDQRRLYNWVQKIQEEYTPTSHILYPQWQKLFMAPSQASSFVRLQTRSMGDTVQVCHRILSHLTKIVKMAPTVAPGRNHKQLPAFCSLQTIVEVNEASQKSEVTNSTEGSFA